MSRPRSRVFGLATVLAAAFALAQLAIGCGGGNGHPGDACTKDFECESGRCVQLVCTDPGASPVDGGTTDAATGG